jgi:hypothetical protein
MAELLVRVVDKVNKASARLDAQCTKRGDVIAVQPDGWTWGKQELVNPEWRILCVPGLTVNEASPWLAPQLPEAPDDTRPLYRRAFHLDLQASTFDGLRAWLDDGTRAAPLALLGESKQAADTLDAAKRESLAQTDWKAALARDGDFDAAIVDVVETAALGVTDLVAAVVEKPRLKDDGAIGAEPFALG